MSITNGLIYQSPSSQDPSGQGGFNGAGNIWMQTDTGNWYVRNSTNSGWTLVGSGDQTSFGLFPLSGGAGSGAITGLTGLMTSDGNTPFAVPPTVTNKSSVLATLYDLSLVQTNLQALINETAAQYISGISAPGVNSNITIYQGVIGPGALYTTVLSLPYSGWTYADGTAVQLSDCHGIASVNLMTFTAGDALWLTPQDTQGMSWQCYSGATKIPGSINYTIIAIRPTA